MLFYFQKVTVDDGKNGRGKEGSKPDGPVVSERQT